MAAVTNKDQDVSLAIAQIAAAEQIIRVKRAQEKLLPYCKMMMPDPEHHEDLAATRFKVEPHIQLLAEALEKVARGECLRLAISMAPQHGKSQTASRLFPSWWMGKFPYKNLMLGTYSATYANNFGEQIRDLMLSPRFRQLFPDCTLKTGSQAKDEMHTEAGGQMIFLGRGGSGTGRPADLFIIDDPIKDAAEADSPTIRDSVWEWFTKVAYTRCHVLSAIIIIQTRWHEDDLIGRLCDPEHPDHNPDVAKDWTYINIPALLDKRHHVDLAKALGLEFNEDGEVALWADRFPIPHLKSARRMNPQGFEALYQGRPNPEDGDYFKREWLIGYSPEDLPKNLRYYSASDHAVTEKQQNDPVCLGTVGIDDSDVIWIMPDLVWERMETDDTVDAIIDQMRRYNPMVWWAENDVIGKAIGPFLRKRMREEKVYTMIDPQTPSKDKRTRARSIQGRMSMKMLRFPKFAPWCQAAYSELLKFPNAKHDDFVDWLAWIGRGLDVELGASRPQPKNSNIVRVGSIEWIKARSNLERQQQTRLKATGGF